MEPDTLQTSALLYVESTKAADEAREISGVATTIDPDTVGDVVIPAGATFAPEIGLFLEHDRERPVGLARLKTHTDRITFTGWLPKIAEAGALQERVDLAWQSVKYRLIRAVSVRLSALKDDVAVDPTTGARTWRKYRISELSLVTMPAHLGAQILTVKSVRSYLSDPAAFRHSADGSPTASSPGDSGPRNTGKPMTPTQQIASYTATRDAKILERDALMAKAAETGVTLDDDQAKTYDALDADIKSLGIHIVRMQKWADQAKDGAKAVETSKATGEVAPRVSVVSNAPPAIGFARVAICKAQQIVTGVPALAFAQSRYRDDLRVIGAIKADVAIGLPTDPEWAGALVYQQQLASEFIAYLRPATIVGQLTGMRGVPFNVRVGGQTSGGSAGWVGAGKPKPVTAIDFAPHTLGIAKVAAIAVLADEVVKLSEPSAEALVRDALVGAVRERIDLDFIDPDSALIANIRPASITNGVAPLTSSGTTPDDVRADIKALLGAVLGVGGSPAGVTLIMPSTTALSLALQVNALGQAQFPGMSVTGGTLAGLKVIVSDYASRLGGSPAYGDVVIAVNAPDILIADDGRVTVDASREATIEMSDTPGGVPAATTINLWQYNCLGLRAERYINWAKARATAVAWMPNVTWGA